MPPNQLFPYPNYMPLIVRFIASLLRIFFNLLYHQFAWTYDLVAWTVSVGQWNDWIQAVIPYLTGDRILEIGHGPGHLQVSLARSRRVCIGLDESTQMSRQAHTRLLRQRLTPHLVNGLAQNLPFPTAQFDHLVATFPSEYIFDLRTLGEAYRMLIPGGSAIILPIAWITGTRLLDRLAAFLFRITGESPAWNDHFLDPARQVGFDTRTEKITLPHSTLLIVILTKHSNLQSA